MTQWIKWNRVRWAKHNLELGLEYAEICPGLSVGEHADSIAQFELRNRKCTDFQYMLAWAVLADSIRDDFYDNGYENSLATDGK